MSNEYQLINIANQLERIANALETLTKERN